MRALDGVADDFVEQLDAVDGGDAVDVLIVEVDEVLLGLGADDQQEKRVDCEHNWGETQHAQHLVHDTQKQAVYRDNVREAEDECGGP